MWLPEELFVYSGGNKEIKVIMKNKKHNIKKLSYQDLVFTQHAEERLDERFRYNILKHIEESFSYFKTGNAMCRVEEVAVQARKYFGQRFLYNEKLNIMMAIDNSNVVTTVMTINKNINRYA